MPARIMFSSIPTSAVLAAKRFEEKAYWEYHLSEMSSMPIRWMARSSTGGWAI